MDKQKKRRCETTPCQGLILNETEHVFQENPAYCTSNRVSNTAVEYNVCSADLAGINSE